MHDSFWDEVDRSRQLTEYQRSQDTLELIDRVRELNLAGIRMQFPDASEGEVEEIFVRRRAIIRDLESRF